MKLSIGGVNVVLVTMVLVLSGCLHQNEHFGIVSPVVVCEPMIVPDCPDSMMTVFIHGTRIFPKFYAQELFYSPEGFRHISQIEEASHMHTIAHELEQADPKRFSHKSFYTFGWNGNLDFQERKNVAQSVYQALKELSDSYLNKYGKRLRLRIITHSHGGNVALNLAAVAKELRDPKFYVDELILLACPVQQETKNFVADPVFGRVYSLSSRYDVLQVVDPQGLYPNNDKAPVFSERYFEAHPHLLQAQVKLYGRFLFHIEFLMKNFFVHLPAIMDALDSWYSPLESASKGASKVPIVDAHRKKVKIYPKKCLANANI